MNDENREIRERQIAELRAEIKPIVREIVEERSKYRYCVCDGCVLIAIKERYPHTLADLANVGLEYLLGGNFNGAAAAAYYVNGSAK